MDIPLYFSSVYNFRMRMSGPIRGSSQSTPCPRGFRQIQGRIVSF